MSVSLLKTELERIFPEAKVKVKTKSNLRLDVETDKITIITKLILVVVGARFEGKTTSEKRQMFVDGMGTRRPTMPETFGGILLVSPTQEKYNVD